MRPLRERREEGKERDQFSLISKRLAAFADRKQSRDEEEYQNKKKTEQMI